MKLRTSIFLSLATGATAFAPAQRGSHGLALHEAKADLDKLATALNPTIKYYDPLSLADADFWDQGNEATIGFLRQSEIKHGRVAMAAFVGYVVQSNWHWPWDMTRAGDPFPATELGPEAQWDAIPPAAKWQIFTIIAALELWDEADGGAENPSHYMRGRQPGKYPSFQLFRDNVHWVLDLYDPFGFFNGMSEEKKQERLVMEINNGRLAMLGIFGFLAADAIPGSVPLLTNIANPYYGSVMAPFASDFSLFSDSGASESVAQSTSNVAAVAEAAATAAVEAMAQ